MVARVEVPDQLYVGLKRYTHAEFPRAVFTSYGDDNSFVRRKQSVDNSLMNGQPIGTFVIDNDLLSGFTLTCAGHAYDGKWKVRDPRGFDVALPFDNIATLIEQAVLHNGEIIGRCRYARRPQGGNVLLLEDTPEFEQANFYTSLQNTSISIRDVQPGYTVYLRNGLLGQYLGYLYPIHSTDTGVAVQPQREHHFLILNQFGRHGGAPEAIHLCRRVRISTIIKDDRLTSREVEDIINETARLDAIGYDRRIRRSYDYFASALHQLNNDNITFHLEPTSYYDILACFNARQNVILIGCHADRFWRTTVFCFERAARRAFNFIDAQRIDESVLLQRGVSQYFALAPTTATKSVLSAMVEHASLAIDQTPWHFVRVDITNPHTGTTISVRLR